MNRIESVGEASIATGVITAGELLYGAQKRGSKRLSERLRDVLERIEILALSPAVGETYGTLRADLEKQGKPIGANDLWIAAHALVEKRTLVTANPSEFQSVAGLSVENWLSGPLP